jgi:WD40 repeat protein
VLLPLVLVLGGAGTGAFWLWRLAEDARTRADQTLGLLTEEQERTLDAKEEAEKRKAAAEKQKVLVTLLLDAQRVNSALGEYKDNEVARARELLLECPDKRRNREWYYVWGLCRGELLSLKGHISLVRGVAYSPDGSRLAPASFDGRVKVWDTHQGIELFPLKGHTGLVYSVCFSPDGKRIASASADQTVKVWDASKGQQLAQAGKRGPRDGQ